MKSNQSRGFPWGPKKFILKEKYEWDSDNKDIFYFSPDLQLIIDNGIWKIPPNAQWDGMTNFWDGPKDKKNPEYHITWEATLVHDLGCKYWNIDPSFPYSRFKIDLYFFKKLKKCESKMFKYFLSYICYFFVTLYTIFLYCKRF